MKSWVLGLAVALAVVGAGNAFGETLGVNLVGAPGTGGIYYSPGLNMSVTANLGGGNSTTDNGGVGAFRWRVNSDSSPGTFSGLVGGTGLYTFCIQLFQYTGNSYTVNSLNSGAPLGGPDAGSIDLLAAEQIQGLVDTYWNKIDFTNSVGTSGAADNSFTGISGSYTDAEVAAAFQISVWEIEYDGGTGGESYNLHNNTSYFNSGALKASGSGGAGTAITLANAWLNSTSWHADTSVSSLALENSWYQDQLFGVPNAGAGNVQPAPLPASLPAGLALIGGLAAFRKYRKSRA